MPRDIMAWLQSSLERLRSNLCSFQRQNAEFRLLLSEKSGITYTQDVIVDTTETLEDISIWGRVHTRRHLLAHWLYSFVTMCADEMFPLFCMSQTGGLGLMEASIGKILSGAGVLYAISQYAVYSTLVHYFGEYTCLTIGSILGIQPATFVPLSLLLSRSSSQVSLQVFSLLSVIMAVCKLFGMLYFSSLALALNRSVPLPQRGTMNGLVVTGASLARSIAPTFAGALTTFSFSSLTFPATYGSLLMYGTLSMVGSFVTIRVSQLKESRENEAAVEMEGVNTTSERI